MKSIRELYNKDHKYYDYPIPGGEQVTYKTNKAKPFTVYHADGTADQAWTFGEKQYTFDYAELLATKQSYQANKASIHEHNELLAKLSKLDNTTLAEIIKRYC